MITQNLVKKILIDPIDEGADELYAAAGYATPNMVSYFMSEIPESRHIKMHLIVGMTLKNGISISVHEGFKDMMKNTAESLPLFECSYVYKNAPVNANLYIWCRNGVPFKAFGGSAGFTQSSFYLGCRETMFKISPQEAFDFYSSCVSDTIYANHSEVEEYIPIYLTHPVLDSENNITEALAMSGLKNEKLSLLAKDGETGRVSGINWGQRKGREPNQAYIAVPASVKREGFFPPPYTVFTVLTDDRKCLIMRVQQQGEKAITTPSNNSLLGLYLRNRIGLASGQYVHRSDLENYGRTDVTFYKLDENQYFMDFGV
ncbi:MAG: NgoFVII family restriction endonuclease [Ruminococcus sp.]|nr:NgoFVII family restriction endonuclease [Ruminococcus sp.]MCM1381604.1 NgoFVII family restriction endonuclease [Muribaculaceae bacterium]MCM1479924.1 NgoFVII family restriction endonuclease [Muribaculaceae bacterium]